MASFDAVVVGTGQAGPALAARLSGAGMSVAVVERGKFGGTCVNDGCTPTKAMVASAYAAFIARRAGDYGVATGAVRVDFGAVMARKDKIVAASNSGVEKWMAGLKGGKVYRGHARFVGPDAVEVGGEKLIAGKIFLNVGGRPLVPDMPGLREVPFLTNQSMMGLQSLPAHLLVAGGSYIGLEFGQMMRRFGSKVTVIEMGPRLVAREDEDVSAALQQMLEAEGIDVRLNAKCLSVKNEPDGVSVGLECTQGAPRAHGTHLLLAVGRIPNTDDLGLERAGVKLDARGYIEVNEALQTSNSRVWALGDCNGKGAFTHTAYNDYEIVADNLLHGAGRKWTDRVPVYALYTDPPLGRVGMNEAEAKKAGIATLVGKRPMTRVSRAVEKGETVGFLKVCVEASSGRILGASLLGVGADEAVHSLIDAVVAKTPVKQFQQRMRIHPTVSELLPTVMEKLEPPAG
ncbi:MAG TPA: FAD-containing oxidoreductase [Burkholderiales bacterium]|nr:FAD-containing oxidoreductase [Burkholderiales bacterium]